MTVSSVDLQETPTLDAGCAGGPAGQYPGLMNLIVSALAALLLLLASFTLAAQTLEADMKQAAVIGAVTMGNGIAHVFAQHGWSVALIVPIVRP